MVFSTGSQARKGMYSSNMSASSYDRPRIWSKTRLTYKRRNLSQQRLHAL